MAKKKEKEAISSGAVSGIKDVVKSIFSLGSMITNIKEGFAEMLERSIKKVIGAVLMIAGLIFLAIGAWYYAVDYLRISKMGAYLSLGIILIFISYMMKYKMEAR